MSRKTSAKSTASMLTVGFHSANPPLIWRFDLERNHSFTLALQGDESGWELGVTAPKGDFYPVAHFALREDADEAFTKVEKELLARKGPLAGVGKALLIVAAAVIVIIGGVTLFGLYASRPHVAASSVAPLAQSGLPGQEATPSTEAPSPEQPAIGIPLSADDVLKAPRQ
jgi:hypothetical protein